MTNSPFIIVELACVSEEENKKKGAIDSTDCITSLVCHDRTKKKIVDRCIICLSSFSTGKTEVQSDDDDLITCSVLSLGKTAATSLPIGMHHQQKRTY
jgi:hypothetical protein